MNENLHKIDNLFSDALDDHEEEPTAAVWQNLERKLDNSSVISITRKYRRLKWVAAASLVFACALGMYTAYTTYYNKAVLNKSIEANKAVVKLNSDDATAKQKDVVAIGGNDTTIHSQTSGNTAANQGLNEDDDKQAPGKKLNENIIRVAENKAKSSTALQADNIEINENSKKNSALIKKNIDRVFKELSSPPYKKLQKSFSSTNDHIILNSSPKSNSSTVTNEPENNTIFSEEDVLKYLAIMPPGKIILDGTATINLPNSSVLNSVEIQSPLPPAGKNISKIRRVKAPKSSVSLSVFFSPDFVSNRVVNDKKVFKEDDKHEIQRTEKRGFSSSFGALINYNLTKSWSLQSGVTFSTIIREIEKKGIYARPDSRGNIRYRFNCSSGYSYFDVKSGNNTPSSGDSLYALKSTNTLQYIGIPLSLQYAFNKSKWSVATGFGLSANFLTKGQIVTVIATGTNNEKKIIRDIHSLKPMYFSGIAGIGVGYELSKNLSITLNPNARFALSSINKEGPVKTYQNNFGIAGGLKITL